MTYVTGDIPIGTYSAADLANLGIGHSALDSGGGYTYLDLKHGHEFSIVSGLTGNFTNPHTGYTNGIDWHTDWSASQFVTRQLQVGAVGYFYQQITPDRGAAPILGAFESRVAGIGPQIGYLFSGRQAARLCESQGLLGIRRAKPPRGLERRRDNYARTAAQRREHTPPGAGRRRERRVQADRGGATSAHIGRASAPAAWRGGTDHAHVMRRGWRAIRRDGLVLLTDALICTAMPRATCRFPSTDESSSRASAGLRNKAHRHRPCCSRAGARTRRKQSGIHGR